MQQKPPGRDEPGGVSLVKSRQLLRRRRDIYDINILYFSLKVKTYRRLLESDKLPIAPRKVSSTFNRFLSGC